MYARRRRVQQIGEAPIRRVRREPRRRTRRERGPASSTAPASSCLVSSRTRGSATASSRSPSNVPNARKPAPMAAHAGHEIDVSRAKRLVHQPSEAWPGGDVLDDERPREQRADHDAVARRRSDAATRATRDARSSSRLGHSARDRRRATNGWCTTSDIACDCRRSNVAAIGSASASAGSGRCQATSTIHGAPGHIARPPPTTCRPPAATAFAPR